ncbi:hypothetical protein K7432_000939 [Basidiobolus ranarum]|uniref:Transcription factor IIIC 90kDa subunit N-terminal domain-containing protein n=1 Tax=Basidiobolus ranarum TaxID=34480 RepID=A0ABR2WAF2_9FUNG
MHIDDIIEFNSRPNQPNSLHWSEDNQIAVITNSAIHILTPTFKGASLSNRSKVLRTGIPGKYAENKLKLKRGLDQGDELKPIAVMAGSYRSAVWSPSSCSTLKGCILAAISTNYTVSLFLPRGNPATSEWFMIEDISQKLVESELMKTANDAETTAISWSKSCSFQSTIACISIIALGSKSGMITLWSYTDNASFLTSFQAHDTWISNILWSSWSNIGSNECDGLLITSGNDGRVKSWMIKISKDPSNHPTALSVEVEFLSELLPNDSRLVTTMKWSNVHSLDCAKLAIGKGSSVYVWSAPNQWLKKDDTTTNSLSVYHISSAMAITGLTWDAEEHELTVFTMDGKILLLYHQDATLAENEEKSRGILQKFTEKCQFISSSLDDPCKEEKCFLDMRSPSPNSSQVSSVVARVFGVDGSANGYFYAITYTLSSPMDMEYKTDQYDNSYLCFCSSVDFDKIELADSVLQLWTRYRNTIDKVEEMPSPEYLYWDIFQFMTYDIVILNDVYAELLMKLRKYIGYDEEPTSDVTLEDCSDKRFLMRWKKELYHNSTLNSYRTIWNISNTAQTLAFGGDDINLRNIVNESYIFVQQRYLEKVLVLMKHYIQSNEFVIFASDRLFISMACDWALRNYAGDTNMSLNIQKIYEFLGQVKISDNEEGTTLREKCPACSEDILFILIDV